MPLGIVISVGGTPDAELSEAAQVVVEEGMMAPARFQLVYSEDIDGAGDLPHLSDARLGPGSDIMVVAGAPDGPQCLIKGPVHGQRIVLAHGGEGSSVEVRGSDTSITLDRESKTEVWAEGPDSMAVQAILQRQYSASIDVEKTHSEYQDSKHALAQCATDFDFVTMLARRNGANFWITCNELGIETAHFKRPDTAQDAAYTLTINQDPPTVTEVEIEWDTEAPVSAVLRGIDPASKSVLNGDVAQSPLSPLGNKALSAVAAGASSIHIAPPADSAGNLKSRGESALIDAGWFVHARCNTSVEALGGIVRPHTVVTLAGAGSRHSGDYYVANVRHEIDAEAHRMNLTLIRNAWG